MDIENRSTCFCARSRSNRTSTRLPDHVASRTMALLEAVNERLDSTPDGRMTIPTTKTAFARSSPFHGRTEELVGEASRQVDVGQTAHTRSNGAAMST